MHCLFHFKELQEFLYLNEYRMRRGPRADATTIFGENSLVLFNKLGHFVTLNVFTIALKRSSLQISEQINS